MKNMAVRFFNWVLSIILIAIISQLASLPARAGDNAILDVIGYSNDGRFFAFEEYGVQDGSGFSYSSIFIVDLNDDSWVVGTPIRVVEEYDEATYEVEPIDYGKNIQAVRAIAHEKAKFRLEGLNITTPAIANAINGDGIIENDGLTLRFGVPGYSRGIIGDYRLKLEIFETQSALSCADWSDQVIKGFLLKLEDVGFNEVEIYRDKTTLPRSRGCGLDYKISGVFTPFQARDISRAVALISVYSLGYEGPDRRFIAVSIGK